MTAFMSAASHRELLHTIEVLGDDACCYSGGPWITRRCDCKYGRWTEHHNELTSEQTGCPELRQIHRVLAHIPPDDWEQMTRRAGYAPHPRVVAGDDVAFAPGETLDWIGTRPPSAADTAPVEISRVGKHADIPINTLSGHDLQALLAAAALAQSQRRIEGQLVLWTANGPLQIPYHQPPEPNDPDASDR